MSESAEQATPQRPQHIGPGRLFIEGGWRDAATKDRREIIDPSTGAVVTTVAEADTSDLSTAVDAARRAIDDIVSGAAIKPVLRF